MDRRDRKMDKQNYDSQDRASIAASRGKNWCLCKRHEQILYNCIPRKNRKLLTETNEDIKMW